MDRRDRVSSFLGFVAVVATLALSVPGVRVAHAEGRAAEFDRFQSFVGESRSAAPAVHCGAADPAKNRLAQVEVGAQQMLAALAKRHAKPGDAAEGPAIVVLNGRGYGYGVPAAAPPAASRR